MQNIFHASEPGLGHCKQNGRKVKGLGVCSIILDRWLDSFIHTGTRDPDDF